ncbi:hypothetical protein [Shewanella japonica]|uniref:hypothetical protein n=1 Tax=Shewanella japonica TaxID=93973 RepID=UPI002494D754|nr:hypothetical protein [Shewanella japonica]
MSQNICKPLGLVDHNNLKSDEEVLLSLNYEMFPDDKVLLVKKGEHLVVSTDYYSKMKKVRRYAQEEYPLVALPWIVDSIENRFFKKPEDGGFSNFERSTHKEFVGEIIGINVMMHCCEENLPGLNIWNGNREDYIAKISPQEWDIPLYMLKEGLLDELKKIAAKYSI